MGFWSAVGSVAGTVVREAADSLERKQQRIQDYMDRYDYYDDERLIQIYRDEHTGYERRTAAARLLKQRGYGRQG
ncbi:hypothetical protein [uncultured Acidaminococcus sp.]|uniref:hypothetical protein n=1 Tax=uncultured Acidaminococcus sp. TaxID=352152 RepID=UPI002594CCF5|nr:hypothetical protein [uncultured Acidaminococcus sp.]